MMQTREMYSIESVRIFDCIWFPRKIQLNPEAMWPHAPNKTNMQITLFLQVEAVNKQNKAEPSVKSSSVAFVVAVAPTAAARWVDTEIADQDIKRPWIIAVLEVLIIQMRNTSRNKF